MNAPVTRNAEISSIVDYKDGEEFETIIITWEAPPDVEPAVTSYSIQIRNGDGITWNDADELCPNG
jgi:hypothetical protein